MCLEYSAAQFEGIAWSVKDAERRLLWLQHGKQKENHGSWRVVWDIQDMVRSFYSEYNWQLTQSILKEILASSILYFKRSLLHRELLWRKNSLMKPSQKATAAGEKRANDRLKLGGSCGKAEGSVWLSDMLWRQRQKELCGIAYGCERK